MILDELQVTLENAGYVKMPSNISEFSIFYLIRAKNVIVINIINHHQGFQITGEQFEQIISQGEKPFADKGFTDIHKMTLFLTDQIETAKSITCHDSAHWIIDKTLQRLVIYEDQPADFYGLKAQIEETMAGANRERALAGRQSRQGKRHVFWKHAALCNVFIIAINVIVFLVLFIKNPRLDAMYMLDHGAMSVDSIVQDKEYYRIITSTFLHFGFSHILNNMLVLYVVGSQLEHIAGRYKFTAIYLLSGIGGNLLSLYHGYITYDHAVSAGASGAVFGVIGALLIVVVKHKGRLKNMTSRRLGLLLISSLYYGFVGTGIDNFAHVGGAVTGAVLAFILYRPNYEQELTNA